MEVPSQTDEETPLLRDNDNGTPKVQTDPITQEQTVIADEPSNKRLALVLGSIWIGVFLGALDSTSKWIHRTRRSGKHFRHSEKPLCIDDLQGIL